MDRKLKILGGILGLTAVIIGAFGAHGLEGKLDPKSIITFETGVKYQMYHALLLIILGFNLKAKDKFIKIIFYAFLIGVVFFSFSIYLLATNELTLFFDFKTIAFLTPIGGLFLILGWGLSIFSFSKKYY